MGRRYETFCLVILSRNQAGSKLSLLNLNQIVLTDFTLVIFLVKKNVNFKISSMNCGDVQQMPGNGQHFVWAAAFSLYKDNYGDCYDFRNPTIQS